MNKNDKEDYISRYNSRFEKFGLAPETLGWGGGQNRQRIRFKAAYEISNFLPQRVTSILDVGCGFGDFGNWLKSENAGLKYKGIDINQKLVDEGKEAFNLDLSTVNILDIPDKSFDIVVANGIFNFQLKHEDHLEYIKSMLLQFSRIAKNGIAVDFMSTYVDFRHENAYHAREQDIVDILKKQTKRYVIRNDYLDYEFMVYVLL